MSRSITVVILFTSLILVTTAFVSQISEEQVPIKCSYIENTTITHNQKTLLEGERAITDGQVTLNKNLEYQKISEYTWDYDFSSPSLEPYFFLAGYLPLDDFDEDGPLRLLEEYYVPKSLVGCFLKSEKKMCIGNTIVSVLTRRLDGLSIVQATSAVSSCHSPMDIPTTHGNGNYQCYRDPLCPTLNNYGEAADFTNRMANIDRHGWSLTELRTFVNNIGIGDNVPGCEVNDDYVFTMTKQGHACLLPPTEITNGEVAGLCFHHNDWSYQRCFGGCCLYLHEKLIFISSDNKTCEEPLIKPERGHDELPLERIANGTNISESNIRDALENVITAVSNGVDSHMLTAFTIIADELRTIIGRENDVLAANSNDEVLRIGRSNYQEREILTKQFSEDLRKQTVQGIYRNGDLGSCYLTKSGREKCCEFSNSTIYMDGRGYPFYYLDSKRSMWDPYLVSVVPYHTLPRRDLCGLKIGNCIFDPSVGCVDATDVSCEIY